MKAAIEELLGIMFSGDTIAIAGHVNPDGDAVGACMAMALCINKIGKTPVVLLEKYNERYNVIPGGQFLYDKNLEDFTPDVFIALDCGDASRLGSAYQVFERTPVTVSIDHHLSNKEFALYNYVNCGASSTCEVIFDVVNMYVPIDAEMATALYAGIVSDTGGFRHSSTQSSTHILAATLLNIGIPFSEIYNELMFTHSVPEARSLAIALNNLVELKEEEIVYSYITLEDAGAVGATPQDFDGIVDYMKNIRGVKLAFFVYETANREVKVSFRSKEVNVSELAAVNGGGGHKYAAGYTTHDTVHETVKNVLALVRNV